MEELIQKISEAAGLDPQTTQGALASILGFVKQHAPEGPLNEMMASMPGAEALAADAPAASAGGGGLMGAIGGLMGGLGGGMGGAMALAGQLSSQGLSMDQMKTVGQELFGHAEQQIGSEKVKEIIAALPGLNKMMG